MVRSEIKSEEENRGSANVGGGDPNYRGENDLLTSGTAQETYASSTTNFDINREGGRSWPKSARSNV